MSRAWDVLGGLVFCVMAVALTYVVFTRAHRDEPPAPVPVKPEPAKPEPPHKKPRPWRPGDPGDPPPALIELGESRKHESTKGTKNCSSVSCLRPFVVS
jgi:hypothetical protein